ncbi:glutamine amidotransferase [Acidimangrovimonas sediminis]|uniref:glutamine amidotransferase n=1 Tax=Acidimangrovimonas sediminis TaxID=2056283 RepID=UPI000C80E3D8|nr:glutamine amidotransferase [Acidimangrovimonas sediminis]
MVKNVLLLGESWLTAETHYKGFDQFNSAAYHLGGEPFVTAVEGEEFHVDYMPSHEAVTRLPYTLDGLTAWDIIVISDIGANTLLLPPDVFLRSQPRPNRLKLLRDWTLGGGGLMMIGGYLTFQGIDGKGRWARTPVEQVLPVTCLPHDDRIEVPNGFSAELTGPEGHPLGEGLSGEWPLLLGANEIVPKPGAEVIARLPEEEGGHPLLACGTYGEGRSIAWASDVGPHWVPQTFIDWPGYQQLWLNCLRWLSAK